MNFVKITLLFTFVLVFVSCNEDEDNLDPDIIGQWQVVEFWDDIEDLDNIYDVQGVNEPVENGRIIKFNSRGEFTNEYYGCVTGNYFIKGKNIHFVCNDSSVPEYVMEYSIDEEERLHLTSLFAGEVCERHIN